MERLICREGRWFWLYKLLFVCFYISAVRKIQLEEIQVTKTTEQTRNELKRCIKVQYVTSRQGVFDWRDRWDDENQWAIFRWEFSHVFPAAGVSWWRHVFYNTDDEMQEYMVTTYHSVQTILGAKLFLFLSYFGYRVSRPNELSI